MRVPTNLDHPSESVFLGLTSGYVARNRARMPKLGTGVWANTNSYLFHFRHLTLMDVNQPEMEFSPRLPRGALPALSGSPCCQYGIR